MVISAAQIARFLQDGAVTVDTPFTVDQIQAAAAAFDRIVPAAPPDAQGQQRFRTSTTCSFFDPELVDLIQHPFLEEVARGVLDAKDVKFLQTAALATYPQPAGPFTFDQHIDLQYTRADLEASPRRIVCTFFLWLSDVTASRAPLMYRAGSHVPLADCWQRQPGLQQHLPRVIGIPLADLPALEYGDPQPVLARAGQATVLTTAMVHGASVNLDSLARKALVVTFTAGEIKVALPPAQQEAKDAYEAGLVLRLRPERRHILAAPR